MQVVRYGEPWSKLELSTTGNDRGKEQMSEYKREKGLEGTAIDALTTETGAGHKESEKFLYPPHILLAYTLPPFASFHSCLSMASFHKQTIWS
jgi:hypothetical protein